VKIEIVDRVYSRCIDAYQHLTRLQDIIVMKILNPDIGMNADCFAITQ
jgi:hypothetical protein